MSINHTFYSDANVVSLPVKTDGLSSETEDQAASKPRDAVPVGDLVRRWRERRHLSQKELANAADVSCRHISFIETGRSRPSRKMVMRLCEVLDLPFRSRNFMLETGGFKPAFTETGLRSEKFADMAHAIDAFMGRLEPAPSVVLDGHWNVVKANESARKLFAFMLGEDMPKDRTDTNLIRWLASEPRLRNAIANWNEVAVEVIRRLHHRIEVGGADRITQSLLDELLDALDTPEAHEAGKKKDAANMDLALPIHIRRSGMAMDFFAMSTKVSGPRDITAQELRLESLHPACPETEEAMRFLQISRL